MYSGHTNGIDANHFEHIQFGDRLKIWSTEASIYSLSDDILDIKFFRQLLSKQLFNVISKASTDYNSSSSSVYLQEDRS